MTIAKTALAPAAAALCISFAVHATEPSAGGKTTVHAGTSVNGSFNVGRQGSSTSYAESRQSASAKLTTSTNHAPGYATSSAGVMGETATQSAGKAYNVSTGSGMGSAASLGRADTRVQGNAAIAGVTHGFNGGSAATSTRHEIRAGTNQGSYVLGQTAAGFGVQVDYMRSANAGAAPAGTTGGTRSSTVGVTGQTSGYAGGTNSYGAITGMKPADTTNIWSNGQFNARSELDGSRTIRP